MTVAVKVSAEVEEALWARRGVVALESTLLAHGMPRERRLDVAARLSAAVRQSGALPAVVAVLDGQVRVGLTAGELERVCLTDGVRKCGERDLAVALSLGGVHATTVSSTCFAAARAGIRVFATGGIGGVHRGVLDTFDESQDLTALARHPVAVVSAGAKAILDLPRTVERLETLGVLVVGFRTQEFPAFYTASSGVPLEVRVDDVRTLAGMCRLRFGPLGQGGVLICNPVPAPHALDAGAMETAIHAALLEAGQLRVHGKALTPFLLAALERLTGGRSVETNVALAEHNALVGGQVAAALMEQSA